MTVVSDEAMLKMQILEKLAFESLKGQSHILIAEKIYVKITKCASPFCGASQCRRML